MVLRRHGVGDQVKRTNPDAATAILAGVAASALGASFYNVLPLYLGVAQDLRGLTTQEIGLIGTVFFSGFTLTTAFGFFWIRRLDWRLTGVAAGLVAVTGLSVGALSRSYPLLLAGLFVAGGALSMIYGIGATALGDTRNPARWYGTKISAEAMFGVALLSFLPATVVVKWGFPGMVWSLSIAILVLVPFLLMLPSGRNEPEADDRAVAGGMNTNKAAVWFALLGCVLFMCGQSAIWAFMERLGNEGGFAAASVGRLLAITLVFALAGSFVAIAIGGRFGAFRPLVAAHMCFFVATAALFRADLFSVYAFGSCLVMFSVSLGISFAFTTVAELDKDGRFVVLTVPAFGLGMLTAPGIAGWIAGAQGYGPVIVFGAITLGASLAAFSTAVVVERRGTARESQ